MALPTACLQLATTLPCLQVLATDALEGPLAWMVPLLPSARQQ